MPKITNPIIKIRLKEAMLNGLDDKNAVIAAGLSEKSAISAGQLKLVKTCKQEIQEELNDGEIIARLKSILRKKLRLEEEVLDDVLNSNKISRREKLYAINKTKDNIAEITKTLRLVSGDSTEKIEVDEKRKERLGSMYDRLKPQQLTSTN